LKRNLSTVFPLVILLIVGTGSIPEKPKVLIIGDSISIGYTPFVKEALAEKAQVFHNPGNAQHTGTGLEKISEWVGDEDWAIIHCNWGLWDLVYRHPEAKVYGNRDKINGTISYTVDEYAANLDSIVTILKSTTDATLIFATTTYVPDGENGRFKKDPIRYNKAAKKVMKRHGILVNDLYRKSRIIHKEHSRADNDVHFTEEGSRELAQIIVKYLEPFLETNSK